MSEHPRLVEVRQRVLKQNDVVARALRDRFRAAGTFVVSLVSSPGSGKTAFLEDVLGRLRDRYRVAALVGDLATDNDARRLARSRCPVRQITTGTVCHLEADDGRSPPSTDGTSTGSTSSSSRTSATSSAPSSFDLGEDLRLVLFSVTEGEDKPLKYPDDLPHRRRGADHQDRPGRRRGLRRRRRPPEHPIRPAGHGRLRGLGEDRRGHGPLA